MNATAERIVYRAKEHLVTKETTYGISHIHPKGTTSRAHIPDLTRLHISLQFYQKEYPEATVLNQDKEERGNDGFGEFLSRPLNASELDRLAQIQAGEVEESKKSYSVYHQEGPLKGLHLTIHPISFLL